VAIDERHQCPQIFLRQTLRPSSLSKPFLSETGYRSFLGAHADMAPRMTPDAFARDVIGAYIKDECKGRLRSVKPEYRERY
jgi:hypothetical protein